MRTLAFVACLALLVMTLAGCSSVDPKRYPDGVPSPSKTTSKSSTGTTSASASRTSTSSGNATAPGNGTGNASANVPPTANVTATPRNGTAPINVTFSLSGSDADGDNLTWVFLYGDGNKTNGTTLPVNLTYEYKQGGNYTPTLYVGDGQANTTANTTLTIAPGTAGTAPGLDPHCQGSPQVKIPPTGATKYYIEARDTTDPMGSSQWMYEESNNIPGLQYSQNPGTNPALGGANDKDPLAIQYNCQNGDTLDF